MHLSIGKEQNLNLKLIWLVVNDQANKFLQIDIGLDDSKTSRNG